MRILLLTNDFPLPVDGGGVLRLVGLAETLGRRHELHLLARERDPAPAALVDELRDRLGAPVETFPGREPLAPGAVAGARRWGTSIARRTPPWVLWAHSAPLAARARELAPAFDVALTLDDNASAYVEAVADRVPVVVDKQNVHGASWVPLRPYGTGLRGRAVHALTLWQLRSWERRTSRHATVVVTSADEGDRFAVLYGRRPFVVPSAIPAPARVADPPRVAPAIAWLGDHTYSANVEGLVRFVEEAWAPLGASGARLLVIGRRPTDAVLALAQRPGVEVLGFVPDLDATLRGAAAAVVPLWRGAGIKMKTLALMGAGLPVVGTPAAFEGIAATDGVEARIAADPGGLADALRDLLDDRDAGAAMGVRAHELIMASHTWEAIGDRYDEILATAVAAQHGRGAVRSAAAAGS